MALLEMHLLTAAASSTSDMQRCPPYNICASLALGNLVVCGLEQADGRQPPTTTTTMSCPNSLPAAKSQA
ncbi:hypothetical protein RvY_17078 [Ramazzottius varieornatus]|uniref:Secreted protein n=1 Tax=Ramazzottius varieornatus TaxID=947166 RepID=A0A1D1W4W6_RAMVA|nr:hypothetical protein RvY_17078 [Ramazzottius varieornatus]